MEKENIASQKSGLKYFLAALGPGFILASTTIGPGSIVSSTNAGANFGYTLFWWFIVMLAFRAVFSLAMNRDTVVTGRPLMVGIREKYGKGVALTAGIFAFIGQCIYGISNFMGCGLGISMLFPGLPVKVGGIIALIVCAALYFLKGLYQKVENVMKVLVAVMAIPVALSCLCPLIIAANGQSSLLSDYASIFAFFLVGCVYVAIGMFISALTESRIIAAVGTFAILLILNLWDDLMSFLPNALSGVLSAFSFRGTFQNFALYNVFDLGGVVLYLSMAALFVFLTIQTLQKRRWS